MKFDFTLFAIFVCLFFLGTSQHLQGQNDLPLMDNEPDVQLPSDQVGNLAPVSGQQQFEDQSIIDAMQLGSDSAQLFRGSPNATPVLKEPEVQQELIFGTLQVLALLAVVAAVTYAGLSRYKQHEARRARYEEY